MDKLALTNLFARFSEQWTPMVIGEADSQYVTIAKAQDEMVSIVTPMRTKASLSSRVR